MKTTAKKTIVMIAALIFLVGMVSMAIAQDADTDDDSGQAISSPHRGEMQGVGKAHRGLNKGRNADTLSEEQIEALQAARTEFKTATRDLRTELQSKQLALKSELVKTEPDAGAAKSLQKEISAVKAELAQKRIEHILEMKEINPYAGTGLVQQDTNRLGKRQGRQST